MSKCDQPQVVTTWGTAFEENGDEFAVPVMMRCRRCRAYLSLGPSNDNIPTWELTRALLANSDDFWKQYEDDGDLPWDVTRPLAEQWPWNGHRTREAFEAHMARGDAMLDELCDREIQGIRDLADDAVPDDGWQERVLAATEFLEGMGEPIEGGDQ